MQNDDVLYILFKFFQARRFAKYQSSETARELAEIDHANRKVRDGRADREAGAAADGAARQREVRER